MALYDSILDTVGNTPIVKLQRLAPPQVSVYAKVESFNPGGSVKDRLALAIILDAEARGLLKPGDTVLLSPACASFDWFRSYEARGDAFRRAVEELIGARPEARVGAQLGGAAS